MAMNVTAIFTATGIIGLIGMVFGLFLGLAGEHFRPDAETREVKVYECLPGTNCGRCGFTDCGEFAQALTSGKISVSSCELLNEDGKQKIEQLLRETEQETSHLPRRAVYVSCHPEQEYIAVRYDGPQNCRMAYALLHDRRCYGFGDCAASCRFEAIQKKGEKWEIDSAKCCGCGCCTEVCPVQRIVLKELEPSAMDRENPNKNEKAGK